MTPLSCHSSNLSLIAFEALRLLVPNVYPRPKFKVLLTHLNRISGEILTKGYLIYFFQNYLYCPCTIATAALVLPYQSLNI